MSVVYTTINGMIVHENRGGVESFYAPDTMGSTVALLNSSGVVTDTYTYWPYGEIRSHVGSSQTPFTFLGMIGYYTDVVGNFIYVRARYLRQALVRWQTVDRLWPAELPYVYCNGSPTRWTDPTGLGFNQDCCNACRGIRKWNYEQCCRFCKSIGGGCSGLASRCAHLGRHPSEGSAKLCEELWKRFCQPPHQAEPLPLPLPLPAPLPRPIPAPIRTGAVCVSAIGLGWCAYECVKWGIAIAAAPATAGGSLAVSAILP